MLELKAGKEYKNRYGDAYNIIADGENVYKLETKALSVRYGGRSLSDLEYVDPSGGPFIAVGETAINGDIIARIRVHDGGIYFDTRGIDEAVKND